jgi:hypothetical protein
MVGGPEYFTKPGPDNAEFARAERCPAPSFEGRVRRRLSPFPLFGASQPVSFRAKAAAVENSVVHDGLHPAFAAYFGKHVVEIQASSRFQTWPPVFVRGALRYLAFNL